MNHHTPLGLCNLKKVLCLTKIWRIHFATSSLLTGDLPCIILGGDQKLLFHLGVGLVLPPEFIGGFLMLWAENEEEQ